jgi:hypothetical protein
MFSKWSNLRTQTFIGLSLSFRFASSACFFWKRSLLIHSQPSFSSSIMMASLAVAIPWPPLCGWTS